MPAAPHPHRRRQRQARRATTGATASTGSTGTSGPSGPSGPPSVAAISSQPTTGDQLAGTSSGRSDAGGALAPAPNPHLFSRSNPLVGVLPGPWYDPLVNLALGAEVPEFYVTHFHVPPFLLPIYQAAGAAYGIPWQVLAAINEVETDYGTNLERLLGRRCRLDAVPAQHVAAATTSTPAVRRRPRTPTTPPTRSSPPRVPRRRRRDAQPARQRSTHTTTRMPTCSRCCCEQNCSAGEPRALVDSVSSTGGGRLPDPAPLPPGYGSLPVSPRPGSSGGPSRRTHRRRRRSPRRREQDARSRAEIDRDLRRLATPPSSPSRTGTIVAIGHNQRSGRYVRLRNAFGDNFTYGNLALGVGVVPAAKRTRRAPQVLSTPLRRARWRARPERRPPAPAQQGRPGARRRGGPLPASAARGTRGPRTGREPRASTARVAAARRHADLQPRRRAREDDARDPP